MIHYESRNKVNPPGKQNTLTGNLPFGIKKSFEHLLRLNNRRANVKSNRNGTQWVLEAEHYSN